MYEIANARLVAGVDEAGRGPLAGPVVAAAVILDASYQISGLTDSKKLTADHRARLEIQIKQQAIAWAIGQAGIAEIDEMNILQASLLAMKRAISQLDPAPLRILVDGNQLPNIPGLEMQAIIKGDLTEPCISAASILAKECRDRQMMALDRQYPQYQFAQHKGYPTRLHRDLLKKHGVSAVHRISFKPVKELL